MSISLRSGNVRKRVSKVKIVGRMYKWVDWNSCRCSAPTEEQSVTSSKNRTNTISSHPTLEHHKCMRADKKSFTTHLAISKGHHLPNCGA